MVKQWVITKTQTGGEGLQTLTVEILEMPVGMKMTEAEHLPRKTIDIEFKMYTDAITVNDILTLGVRGITVRE
jgi:hypothetical protein